MDMSLLHLQNWWRTRNIVKIQIFFKIIDEMNFTSKNDGGIIHEGNKNCIWM